MKIALILPTIALLGASAYSYATQLLREPDVRNNTLVFSYANDIWKTTLTGGNATRVTSFQGEERMPKLSPSGDWIAFTGEYAGNNDVYLVSANGGEVSRLTFHPGNDEAVGWSPDGKSILFRSTRSNAPRGWARLYTIAVEGGNPSRLPMNRAYSGAYSQDGESLAFRRAGYWDKGWRNYRGGQNQALRVIDLEDLKEYDLPFENEFDIDPVWIGDDIYYLSNKSKVANVFKYSTSSKKVEQVTASTDFDVMSFSADNQHIVYEYLGDLYLLNKDAQGAKGARIPISIDTNFYWLRDQYVDASKTITSFNFSPNGKRAVFSARGDIFTVPVEHGSPRNLTDTSGIREEGPAWSPDGTTIAWFSDASGEYKLILNDQKGNQQKEITLAGTGFYSALQWSADGKRVTFSDQKQQLWVANTENGSTKVVDQNVTTHPEPSMMASWSPDSQWLAYTTQNINMFRELFVYSVKQRKSFKISDGLAEIQYPVWDTNGERLYFLASTDYGPKAAWLDMSTIAFTPNFHLYYALVNNSADSPLLILSDEEEIAKEEVDANNADEEDNSDEVVVNIDIEGIIDRTMPLSSDAGQFSHLKAGTSGQLFYLSSYTNSAGQAKTDLMRYSVEERSASTIASEVQDFRISDDGESILAQSKATWRVFASTGESSGDDKLLNMKLQKRVNFAQEWQQIFREAWRYQRDYLYVDNFHGADWDLVYKTYQPLVASVSHPADLTYLLDTMGAEVSIGHSYTRNGEQPEIDRNQIGLLGVDFAITEKGVKIAKVYSGDAFFPSQNMAAPLAKVAHKIAPGSYLQAVNGKAVDATQNIYKYFEGTLGQVTSVTLGVSSAQDDKSTSFLVTPIANDVALRRNDWVESNRRYVDEKSDGKLAYVWIPDTAENGYVGFNRYFFAQSDRQGVILDERFNHGGFIADYIIGILRRELNGFFNNPFKPSQPMTSPGAGIWGTQVMLINEVSGSGGDMLPYMFNHYKLGTLVGKRTWGGLVGIWGVPPLVDGGAITAPRSGFYDLNGEWQVENEGVAPDIDVEQWTKDTAKGRDPQLDKAIEIAMEAIKTQKNPIKSQPKPPVRVPNPQ